ncbi:hypothetical protein PSP6_630013 [Paraburkholderia tropica]|nr:hypothetical protein PSP6_630013 [Paraburkholderia tropica]
MLSRKRSCVKQRSSKYAHLALANAVFECRYSYKKMGTRSLTGKRTGPMSQPAKEEGLFDGLRIGRTARPYRTPAGLKSQIPAVTRAT